MFLAWVEIQVTPDGRFCVAVFMNTQNETKNIGSLITPDFFAAVRASESLQIYADNLMRS